MRLGLARHRFWEVAAAALAQGENPPFQAPAGVEIRPDIVYARYGARQIPAVVYVHGGGWSGGNKNAFRRHAAHMATKGFVGACVEYRLSGEAKWPAAFDDAKAALAYVRQHAAELKVDPRRIGAAGGSAGGHLVGLLGTMSNPVRAVAAFNPAVDLVSFAKSTPTNADDSVVKFLGATYQEKPDLWAEASPITHAGPKSAAFLFLHGDADTTVPYKQSVDMMKKLQAAGVKAEIFTAPGAAHGFFNRPPWFEPTLKRMEEFFLKQLK